MSVPRSAAVLGGGIMGSAVALHLARRGAHVTLFEREREPFAGASRWNEGKIHLGFLYAADPSLATARALLADGLGFPRQVRDLTGAELGPVTTRRDDIYLIHRDSVVGAEEARAYFGRVAEMVRSHPAASSYLADVSGCQFERLTREELESVANPAAVAAGFRVPERSVDTNHVADAFVAALRGEAEIDLICGQTVTGVTPAGDGNWGVETSGERHGPFGAVVNALWEGRPAVDRSVGHGPDQLEQHRYRVSVFARTARELDLPSAVVSVGPFGDVKNYDGRTFYASWYEAGLLARRESVEPPPLPVLDEARRERVAVATFGGLAEVMPWVTKVRDAATEVRVEGGWVYSQGRGLLDDPQASVHRRERLGVTRLGSYVSVDTGKYSVAPALAERIAEDLVHCGPD